MYGRAAEMDEILEIAKRYNLKVIEDCAQAFGTEYKSKRLEGLEILEPSVFSPLKTSVPMAMAVLL